MVALEIYTIVEVFSIYDFWRAGIEKVTRPCVYNNRGYMYSSKSLFRFK